ncbi:ABC transporter substrate-binding protein [Vibrio natriegens]|uniref:transporter substrate-binding domain-containing protein n=1 Tax=Vibrio natriegens TaxID=691 RepID=UPI0008046E14|nr:transporter substrate-binding domain-containing protein [Vibrio natriegens]ANQ24698.1 ABC transporter substrate-binding protein [Vibrio natriegens]
MKSIIKRTIWTAALCFSTGVTTVFAGNTADITFGSTLKNVKKNGALNCSGHNGSFPGFAELDNQGKWKGFDVELCKALATAIFGDYKEHLNIKPTSWAQRWPSLKSGELDVIIKVTGWTMGRDTDIGLQFSRVYMMLPSNYMVHKSSGVTKPEDLDGGTLCVQSGTTYERYAADYSSAHGYEMKVVPFEKTEDAKAAYESGRCDAYIGTNVELGVIRATELKNPEEHLILPQPLAAEPIAMAVRQGDDNWIDIANWLLSVLVMAEENGVTSANVDQMKSNPPTPAVAKMLGVTPGIGSRLGLSDDWAYQVIKRVGNYSEIYEQSLGKQSPYKLDRGINALVKDSGILYSLVMD